eukprot:CAMPEP_0176490206 /NCGR_PEP_ID=MMETSP0200_2-20121128/7741_1 /TAXON_ID=947934 /ORGANISM="Chaetoceros sp., Strain GSL56" /LENGTH=215 /DNA_ID=CAMNT_0017887485 /DNA_START=200 /DNA_END=844 /DNA_ORIENTATION=-
MSDSDSSISINYVASKSKSASSTRKRPMMSLQSDDSSDSSSDDEDAAFTFSKHRFSASAHGSEQQNNVESESDSEDSVLQNMRRSKKAARISKTSRELYQDSDSDNDAELQVVDNKTQIANTGKGDVVSRDNRTIMIDSDDSDDELGKLQIVESEAMKKARLAREALSTAPSSLIDIQDDENSEDGNYVINDIGTEFASVIQPPKQQQALLKGPI